MTGDGVTKVEGFVIFVKGARGGDGRVRIKVDSVGPRLAIATSLGAQVGKADMGKTTSDSSLTEPVG